MKTDIFLFGITREIVGNQKITLDLPNGTDVASLKEKLLIQYPDLTDLKSVMVAINNEYAENEQVIRDNDEVALIPPVSGG